MRDRVGRPESAWTREPSLSGRLSVGLRLLRTCPALNSECSLSKSRPRFCSYLAMRGAPVRAIQELAGHQDLTTQRYMRLSPAALDSAILLLDSPGFGGKRGDILETDSGEQAKSRPSNTVNWRRQRDSSRVAPSRLRSRPARASAPKALKALAARCLKTSRSAKRSGAKFGGDDLLAHLAEDMGDQLI
jgi:hypothetical protein